VEPAICSQLCVTRRGGYECSCVDGYQLTADRRHCVVTSARWKTWTKSAPAYSAALVFYTQSGRIISRSARTGAATGNLVYRATGLVSALGLYSIVTEHMTTRGLIHSFSN